MVRKPWQQQYLHDIFQDKCFSLPFSSPRFCQLLEACFVKWISGSEKLLWFERASITVWSLPAFVTKACLNPSGLIFFCFMPRKNKPSILPYFLMLSSLMALAMWQDRGISGLPRDTDTYTHCQHLKCSAWLPESDFVRVHSTMF